MGGENTGQVSLPLVGGTTVNQDVQEEFGLLKLGSPSGNCSASLLRNTWAITAAHCLEVPNPAGGVSLANPAAVQLTALWGGGQTQQAAQVISFRPVDLALIRLAAPFSVFGSTTGYSRLLFRDPQFPYFGAEVPVGVTLFGAGITQFAQGSGMSATPAQNDGRYRVGYAQTTRTEANLFWYSSSSGDYIAGGDSGGPTYAWVLGGYALMGVHALTNATCVPGQPCGPWNGPGSAPPGYNPWQFVAGTPEAADASIRAIWQQIEQAIGPPTTPPDYQVPTPQGQAPFGETMPVPLYLYAIPDDGRLLWYSKDALTSRWFGPQEVGSGWDAFVEVIPAGGPHFYALKRDGTLLWYEHTGFSSGSFKWKGPVEVGNGWKHTRIFPGGQGIVYAVGTDGALLWYRHGGYEDGSGVATWSGPKVIASGWSLVKHVFSLGQGSIYAIRSDGRLLRYQHDGFESGDAAWHTWHSKGGLGGSEWVEVGTGWQNFRQIVPVHDGVILAITRDGRLLAYRDLGGKFVSGTRIELGHWEERWEGPLEIGSGWQDFTKVFALMVDPADTSGSDIH